MKKIVFTFLLLVISFGLMAQIPAKVNEIMDKVGKSMDSPNGSTVELKVNVSMLVSLGNIYVTSYDKDEKSYSEIEGSLLGKKLKSITGYDGQQSWEYDSVTDSLKINMNKKEAEKSEYGLDLDMSKEFKKASLKEKKETYEITFTEPIKEKEAPSKAVFTINKSDFILKEMSVKMGPAKMTMTVTKFLPSVTDESVFVFDQTKFPNAKVEYIK